MATGNSRIAVWTGLGVLVVATPASANMLVPLMAQGWLILVVLLVPIIAIETVCLSLRLGGVFWQALEVTTLVNLASTFFGIPVACLLHRCLTSVTPFRFKTRWDRLLTASVHAPWEIGASDDAEQRLGVQMAMHASLVLVIVFFLASWLVEASIATQLLPHIRPRTVWVGMLSANLASYGLLTWLAWRSSESFPEEVGQARPSPTREDSKRVQRSPVPTEAGPLRRTDEQAGEPNHVESDAA